MSDSTKRGSSHKRWTINMLERRARIILLKANNLPPSQIVNDLMDDPYNVSSATAWRDLRTYKEWILEFNQIRPTEMDAIVAEADEKLSIAEAYFLNTYISAGEHRSAQVGALKGYVDTVIRKLEFKQSMGVISKAPEEHIVTGEVVKRREWSFEELFTEYGEQIDEAIEAGVQKASREANRQDSE